jgi:cytochrome c oxidase assembly protein subunit 15
VKFVNALFAPARLRLYVWLSLVSQILIVVTGGVVRLTGSGLGCPTWPKCTEDSLVTVPEMGIHGIIEFGNRLLTFALLVIALLTLVTVLRSKDEGRNLRVPAFALILGIVAQAVLGGITVLVQLNPWIVGAHFVVSGILIATAAVLLRRGLKLEKTEVSSLARINSAAIVLVGWITVLVGVAVTGAGPHSGDADTPRNGLDLEIWQHYHSYPGYTLIALVVLQLWLTRNLTGSIRLVTWLLVSNVALQAVVGVIQARMGVPPLLVAIHLLGASTAIALLTLQRVLTKAPAVQ